MEESDVDDNYTDTRSATAVGLEVTSVVMAVLTGVDALDELMRAALIMSAACFKISNTLYVATCSSPPFPRLRTQRPVNALLESLA